MASEEGEPVDLYIYDLTRGMASLLSPAILGRQIEGVWHTSVVVYGREYFFGGGGITSCDPGSTSMGQPLQVERLGTTFVPFQLFVDYVHSLSNTSYTPSSYNLLSHNCNNFSDDLASFLCGGGVPKHILRLPEEALSPPLRAALAAMLDRMQGPNQSLFVPGARQRRDSPDFQTLNDQIEQARLESAALEERRNTLAEKLARKERKREKRKKKMLKEQARLGIEPEPEEDMAEALPEAPPAVAAAGPSRAEEEEEEETVRRPAVPPILYNDMDPAAEFEKFKSSIQKMELTPDEQTSVDELRQYLVDGEGSWVLGDNFPDLLGRILSPESNTAARVGALRCIACCARRDDVSLLLHADRRRRALMGLAARADTLSHDEQHALALMVCNLFELVSSSEWLMYISEWEEQGRPLSNIRATTKVCVTALLSDTPELREIGAAILYNIATKEVKTVVFDEVSVELGMAALQFLSQAPGEELLWRALAALRRLVAHSTDLPQLVTMVGPDPQVYRGTSQRCDEEIDQIMKKVK